MVNRSVQTSSCFASIPNIPTGFLLRVCFSLASWCPSHLPGWAEQMIRCPEAPPETEPAAGSCVAAWHRRMCTWTYVQPQTAHTDTQSEILLGHMFPWELLVASERVLTKVNQTTRIIRATLFHPITVSLFPWENGFRLDLFIMWLSYMLDEQSKTVWDLWQMRSWPFPCIRSPAGSIQSPPKLSERSLQSQWRRRWERRLSAAFWKRLSPVGFLQTPQAPVHSLDRSPVEGPVWGRHRRSTYSFL